MNNFSKPPTVIAQEENNLDKLESTISPKAKFQVLQAAFIRTLFKFNLVTQFLLLLD